MSNFNKDALISIKSYEIIITTSNIYHWLYHRLKFKSFMGYQILSICQMINIWDTIKTWISCQKQTSWQIFTVQILLFVDLLLVSLLSVSHGLHDDANVGANKFLHMFSCKYLCKYLYKSLDQYPSKYIYRNCFTMMIWSRHISIVLEVKKLK